MDSFPNYVLFKLPLMTMRKILDGVFIAKELIDLRKHSKKERVIFKVDLRRHTITWSGIPWSICWAGWVLVKNG